ncbi:MAG: DUF2268 domain-containing putative Zn-dependent protease [Bacteroidota bacterium]
MFLLKRFWLVISLGLTTSCNFNSNPVEATTLNLIFQEENEQFTRQEEELIRAYSIDSEEEVRNLLPHLPDSIQVQLEIVDWNLEGVGGITGRAESNSPPLVLVQISNTFPGGITAAIETGLKSTLYHEFHHLARGWAVHDNKYGPGIGIAMVNEGLAEVFAEQYTGEVYKANQMPSDVNASDWVNEILRLPTDASYYEWMFEHPDGRNSVGYRTGNYLIKKVMQASGKNILELSELSPEEIISLSGYSIESNR